VSGAVRPMAAVRLVLAFAVVSTLTAGAPPTRFVICHDASGRIMRCPPQKAAAPPCRLVKVGHVVKCGAVTTLNRTAGAGK